MILYYAPGSGFGHFTRAQAVMYTLKITAPVLLAVSAAPPNAEELLHKNITLLSIPHLPIDELTNWVEHILEKHRITQLFVDTFASGIHGELQNLPLTTLQKRNLIARRLRPDVLQPLQQQWDCIYLTELVSKRQHRLLTSATSNIITLRLSDAPVPKSPALNELQKKIQHSPKPHWMIVHSGPEEERQELFAYAKDSAKMEGICPMWIFITPSEPTECSHPYLWYALYPSYPLYTLVDRIYCGAGFNMVRQVQELGCDVRFIPFDRRWDDQYGRIEKKL